MWIEIFEQTERDSQVLLNRLEYMHLNIKSHKEKGTPYDQKIIKYLNAWGLDKQDNPDVYLSNTNEIWEKVTLNLTKIREHLGQKEPDSSMGALSALGNLMSYLEEVMNLRSPGSESTNLKNDFIFSIVYDLASNSVEIAKKKAQFRSIDAYEQSLFNELSKNNPWSKYAS